MSLQKIQQDLQQLISSNSPNYHAEPISQLDKHNWHGTIDGIKDSPYQGGRFIFTINFPQTYPDDPLSVRFMTRIFHPNVLENGTVALQILRKEFWSPKFGIVKVLEEIHRLMRSPNLDQISQPSIAHIFENKRKQFDEIAKEWTSQYAM